MSAHFFRPYPSGLKSERIRCLHLACTTCDRCSEISCPEFNSDHIILVDMSRPPTPIKTPTGIRGRVSETKEMPGDIAHFAGEHVGVVVRAGPVGGYVIKITCKDASWSIEVIQDQLFINSVPIE